MTSPTYQRELKKAVRKMDLITGPPPIFCAIDVETTLNGNEDIGLAHPMHPDNRVVAYGMCVIEPRTTYDCDTFDAYVDGLMVGTVLCGHNISFDLMYLYKESTALKYKLQTHKIWDTQLAEYILSGQRTKFSSLDELSVKYGLPIKDDGIKK